MDVFVVWCIYEELEACMFLLSGAFMKNLKLALRFTPYGKEGWKDSRTDLLLTLKLCGSENAYIFFSPLT